MHTQELTTTRHGGAPMLNLIVRPDRPDLETIVLVAALNSTRPLNQPAPLSASAIIDALGSDWRQACIVEAVASTVSTNEDLVTRARAQQPTQLLLRAADFQHAGRGRSKRIWHAAAGDALLFSVAIPLSSSSQSLPAVTLACGVALAETFVERGIAARLKWPNDIQVEGCKLGGILTELVADRSARQTLVVGVGVNVCLDERMRRIIGQPSTALDQLPGAKGDLREQWIGRLGGAIYRAASQFIAIGFEPFRERYNQLLESRGELVDVLDVAAGAPLLSGHLIEVDHHGRLVIEADGQRHALNVGDVSIRR